MSNEPQYLPTISAPRSEAHGVTAVPRDLINDESLSFDARGLMAHLLSFDHARTLSQMVEATSDGTDTTRRALEELVERGLVAEVAR